MLIRHVSFNMIESTVQNDYSDLRTSDKYVVNGFDIFNISTLLLAVSKHLSLSRRRQE